MTTTKTKIIIRIGVLVAFPGRSRLISGSYRDQPWNPTTDHDHHQNQNNNKDHDHHQNNNKKWCLGCFPWPFKADFGKLPRSTMESNNTP